MLPRLSALRDRLTILHGWLVPSHTLSPPTTWTRPPCFSNECPGDSDESLVSDLVVSRISGGRYVADDDDVAVPRWSGLG